ncbi:MAG: hypothetical protein IJH91_07070 [Mogibacterium sp.]|nr:hypothetical protein [Mogibacterium sp.]
MGLLYEMNKNFGELLNEKTNFVFIGEAGSGKSEIVLNVAAKLARDTGRKVDVFDMDQTKPLYRSRDMKDAFAEIGVDIHYQDQFLDAPTAVGGVATSLSGDQYTLLDVGGGHPAARMVGGYAQFLRRDNAAPVYIVNPFRPWTKSIEAIDGTMSHILGASRLDHIYLLGNPNLGYHTTADDIVEGLEKLDKLFEGITTINSACVKRELYDAVADKTDKYLLPIELYLTYSWVDR